MNLIKNPDKRIVEFVITVPSVVDKEGDIVPEDEIEEALDNWLERGGSMNDAHSNHVVGRATRFWHDEKNDKYIGRAEVFRDSILSDNVWAKIKSGEYASVSIGGAAFEKEPNEEGGETLKGLEISEVSFCQEGMHQDSNIQDFNAAAKIIGSVKNIVPFIAKGIVKRYNSDDRVEKPENLDRCVADLMSDPEFKPKDGKTKEESAFAVCNSSVSQNKGEIMVKQTIGGNGMTEIKKVEGVYVGIDDFQALAARVAELETGSSPVGVAPVEEVMTAKDHDEDKPEDKPETEEEKLSKVEADASGTTDPEPDEEGEEVKIPLNQDDRREPQGTPGDGDTDEPGEELLEKMISNAVAKSMKSRVVKTSSTPVPKVEKIGQVEEKPDYAWELAKGRMEMKDLPGVSRVDQIQREMNYIQKREAHFKKEAIRGVVK